MNIKLIKKTSLSQSKRNPTQACARIGECLVGHSMSALSPIYLKVTKSTPAAKKGGKMQYKIVETINPLGRYIYPNEFRWLMNYFRDRYDPRRLCLALMIVTGLRTENAVNINLKDFIESFQEVRVPECKAHII